MAQQQVSKRKSQVKDGTAEETVADATNPELAEQTDQTLDAIDEVLEDQLDAELLAAMDEVMGTEEEAQAMVDDFIQKGGE